MVTHQLQVERRTGKVRRPETDVLPLCHATNLSHAIRIVWCLTFACIASCARRCICTGLRASDFIVGLTNSAPARHPPGLWAYTLCAQYPGTVEPGRTVTLQCASVCERQLQFRYLVVQFPLHNDSMTVCEVEVFAIGTRAVLVTSHTPTPA